MILSIGEILVDMIGNKEDQTIQYSTFAGGAPFNVACGIKKFGGHVTYAGNVGNDIMGRFLIDFAKQQNLDKELITLDNSHNTTLAFVKNDANGERDFCFYRMNTADYFINESVIEEIKHAKIVHLGSLMLSKEAGRLIANKIINEIKRQNKKFSFDINFRNDLFTDVKEAIGIYQEYAKQADIVKYSLDEIQLFSGKEDIHEALKLVTGPNQLVFLTLGKDGSMFYHDGNIVSAPSIKVTPVDTTGAGDAFYAGILTKLDQVDMNAFVHDQDLIREVLRFANIAGALATTAKGAISAIPALEKINEFM